MTECKVIARADAAAGTFTRFIPRVLCVRCLQVLYKLTHFNVVLFHRHFMNSNSSTNKMIYKWGQLYRRRWWMKRIDNKAMGVDPWVDRGTYPPPYFLRVEIFNTLIRLHIRYCLQKMSVWLAFVWCRTVLPGLYSLRNSLF